MEVLKAPCTYQGGKQRVATEIVDNFASIYPISDESIHYYDLCCGSGAITIELLNRGVQPEQIIMCDKSVWGLFWKEVGKGTFSMNTFHKYSKAVPRDPSKIPEHIKGLAAQSALVDTAYKYILLQAASFGGKQIWCEGTEWKNASFRSYWKPTENSNRRSVVNPMMPMIDELENRVELLVDNCKGLTCYNADVLTMLEMIGKDRGRKIVYIDPPYKETTGYGFNFDLDFFINSYKASLTDILFISEKVALSENAIRLQFAGNKGGINGQRLGKNEEWLSIIGEI